MFARRATNDDVDLILEIFNAHQMHVAPNLGTNGLDWALDFVQGYPEPYQAWLLSDTEDSIPFAIGNLNPSSNAKRFMADISIRPEVDRLDEVITFFRKEAEEFADGWALWISCNANDEKYNQVLLKQGFKVIRYFNSLRKELNGEVEPVLPENVTTKLIDIHSDSDMKIWHDLRLDAFGKHFGFIPRPFEQFVEIMRRDPMMKIAEVHVLFENGIPAGYIWINDEAAHELTGYVANLGVAYAFQGRGYGQYLLAKAVGIYAQRGFKLLDLGVDTANESGALRLYEKMGFKVVTTWTQYEA